MKPEDFKPKHNKQERLIYIDDRILFVPNPNFPAANIFSFPGWSSPEIFGNLNPVSLEYCSGNGSWIAEKAIQYKEKNWVAVEMKFDRVRKIWAKIKNHQLKNLFIICAEAYNATSHYFPNDSISEIFINFPDPWPKKRHAKYRLIQQAFIQQIERVLLPNKSLTFVTDDIPYSEWFIEIILKEKAFKSSLESPYYTNEKMDSGTSYFEELWKSRGLSIRTHIFKKR